MNFNFGEHYYISEGIGIWLKVGLTFLSSFLGFGFSLLLYYLRNKSDKKLEDKKIIDKNRGALNYFSKLLAEVLEDDKKQSDLTNSYIGELKSDLTNLDGLKQIATNNFQRLKLLNNKELFDAWIDSSIAENSVQEFLEILYAIDFLEASKAETIRISSVHNEHIYQKLLSAKKIIDYIPDELSSIARSYAANYGEQRWELPYYLFLDGYIKKYHSLVEGKAPLKTYSEDFLKPIIDSYLEDFKELPEADSIMNKCKAARMILGDVKTENSQFIEELEKIPERKQKSIQVIENTVKRISDSES